MEYQDQLQIQSQTYQFSSLSCWVGLDWSWVIFIYAHCEYDPEDMWKGTFRSAILITVSETQSVNLQIYHKLLRAYKHVFTSPSSVDKISKAMWSGNACIHGMTSVTLASIAYIYSNSSTYNCQVLHLQCAKHFSGTWEIQIWNLLLPVNLIFKQSVEWWNRV